MIRSDSSTGTSAGNKRVRPAVASPAQVEYLDPAGGRLLRRLLWIKDLLR
jgi:hypothetical protein